MLKRWLVAASVAVVVSLVAANPAVAQVKRVEMNIAGYLCGF